MSGRLALAGWALLAALLWALAPSTGGVGAADAQRVVALDLGQEGSARVRVTPDTALRLVLHLDVDEADGADPLARWTYGVALRLVAPDGAETAWTHHVESRVSLDAALRPRLQIERPGRRLTDGRVLDLDAGFAPRGGVLEIAPGTVPGGTRLVLRLVEVTGGARPGPDRERAWPAPFPALDPAERAWFAGRIRRTLAPEALDGETVAVLVRDVPELPDPRAAPRRLRPGEATAINLVGPARLRVAARRPSGRAVAGALRVDAVSAAGPVALSEGELLVPDGALWSLRLHNVGDEPVVPEVLGEGATPWGEPPAWEEGQLRPDERRLHLARVGPADAPLVVPVDSGGPVGVLRIDARGPDPDAAPAVRWVARAEDGAVVAEGGFAVPWTEAPFERYAEPQRGRPGEVVTRFVLHPRAARTVELSADAPVDLRFLVPSGVRGAHPDAYAAPEGLAGRYAPWIEAPWVAIEPLDRPGLLVADRVSTLVATVRLEPHGPATADGVDPLDALVTRTVRPRGELPRFPMLEPVLTPGPFQPWHRTRMGPGVAARVPEDGALLIDHRVPARAVGASAAVDCEGLRQSAPLRSARGRLRFAGLPAGVPCRLIAPEGQWFARAPGTGEVWAHRTLYRADRDRLQVDVPELADVGVLYVRAYTPLGAPPPTVLVEIDGGVRTAVTDLVGRPTDFARLYVPEEARGTALLDNGGALQQWRGMRVTLGEDLVGRPHVVEVQATAADGGPVYVRLDASWWEGARARAVHWPEMGP